MFCVVVKQGPPTLWQPDHPPDKNCCFRTTREVISMKHQMWLLADLTSLPHITMLQDASWWTCIYRTVHIPGDLETLSCWNPWDFVRTKQSSLQNGRLYQPFLKTLPFFADHTNLSASLTQWAVTANGIHYTYTARNTWQNIFHNRANKYLIYKNIEHEQAEKNYLSTVHFWI